MQLALQMVSGYGAEFSAWKMPGTEPAACTNMDRYVERVKLAEKGKLRKKLRGNRGVPYQHGRLEY